MMLQMQFATLLALISICKVLSQVPDSMPAPTVDSILATSFTVNFQSITGALKYYVTVTPRHSRTIPRLLETSIPTANVQNLTEFTIYYVSVQAENASGIGEVGNMTEVRTLPRLLNLHLGAPLLHTVDIFFNMKCSIAITKWTIQYLNTISRDETTLNATATYSFRVSGLEPDTSYRIRAQPLELDGTTLLTKSEELYSNWASFTTDSLSIFGRVVLTNVTYTANHKTQYGPEWNSSREIIEDGYSSISNNGISLIRIEDDGSGKAQIHYRVKVKDKSLPSPTDFSLNGTDFTGSSINNGGEAVGTPFIYKNVDAWTLIYSPLLGSSCSKLVERYMIVTTEDEFTFEIHLNVASSEATTANEDDALRVESDGRLMTDDGKTARTVSLGTVLVLSPRFLVKDCLKTDTTSSLYTEYFDATDVFNSPNLITQIYESTDPASSLFNDTAVTYTSSFTGTSVTLSVPAVAKAIKYEVLNSIGNVVSTLQESDIDCSDFLKLLVNSLVNGTTYNFVILITTQGGLGRTTPAFTTNTLTRDTFTTNSFSVTPTAAPLSTTALISTSSTTQITNSFTSTTMSAFTTYSTNTTISASASESSLPVWGVILSVVGGVCILGAITAGVVRFVGRPSRKLSADHRTENGAEIYATDRII